MTEEKVPADEEARLGTDPTGPRRGTLADSVVSRDGETLLDYEILAAPNPLQADAPATLTLVVSNGTHVLVTCTAITLTLSVGTNAKDLVASAEGITSQAPTGWSVGQSGGTFTLTPQTPAAGQIGAAGLSFVFAGLAVNDQVGTTIVTIGETASTPAQPPQERTGTIVLPKFPAQFALGDLTARPLEVSAGDSATLNWSGSPATYHLEFNPGSGAQSVPVGNAGPYVASGLTRYPEVVFTLVVSYAVPGQDQPVVAQKQAIVQVDAAAPAVTSFTGSVDGAGVTFHWDSRDADSCSMNALPQLLKPSGSAGPLPLDRIRYSLVANASRTGTSSAPRNVDLHLTVARQQPLTVAGYLGVDGMWLALAGDGSTLVATLHTDPNAFIFLVDRGSLSQAGLYPCYSPAQPFALSRDGARLFISTWDRNESTELTVLAVPSLKARVVPWSFDAPVSAAFSPDGATLYMAGKSPEANVHVLDASLVEQRSFAIPDVGVDCAVSDDGSRLYVAGGESLVVADTATGAIVGQPAIGGACWGAMVLDPARERAYVTRPGLGTVSIVDLAAMTQLCQVPVGGNPFAMAMGPGGGEIYVAGSASQSVTVIDADALAVITTISFPSDPVGLAIAPGAPLTLYVLTSPQGKVPIVYMLQVTS
jgi:YVTN family beta-propeller protein